MIYASIHGRLATQPKQYTTKAGNDMCNGFLLVNLDVRDDEQLTVPMGLVAFGKAALELARVEKGQNITVAGKIQGSRYEKAGETVEQMQMVAEYVIGPKTARSAPRSSP